MSKHVLVFGGFYPQHQKIADLGADLTIMTTTNKIKGYYPNLYKRVVTLEKDATKEDWIAMAKAINSIEKVDVIGAFQDLMQKEASWVAEALNIPCNSSVDVLLLIENKYLMRERLRAYGVDQTKNTVINSFEEAIDFLSGVSYPLMLKPVDSFGSTGIYKINNEKELKEKMAHFESKYPNLQMCLEEFIEGDEYSVEAFSQKGNHFIYGVTKKYKESERFVEMGHTVPAPLSTEKENKIKDFVKNVLQCLGVINGPTHTEVIVNDNGVYIIETHNRLGGDMIPELFGFSVSNKINMLELVAKHTLHQDVLEQLKSANIDVYASIYFKAPEKAGVIKSITGLNEAKQKDGVQLIEIYVKEGDEVTELLSSFSRIGHAVAIGNTAEESLQRAKDAIDSIQWEIE